MSVTFVVWTNYIIRNVSLNLNFLYTCFVMMLRQFKIVSNALCCVKNTNSIFQRSTRLPNIPFIKLSSSYRNSVYSLKVKNILSQLPRMDTKREVSTGSWHRLYALNSFSHSLTSMACMPLPPKQIRVV